MELLIEFIRANTPREKKEYSLNDLRGLFKLFEREHGRKEYSEKGNNNTY